MRPGESLGIGHSGTRVRRVHHSVFFIFLLEFIIHPRIMDYQTGYPTLSPKTIMLRVQNFAVAEALYSKPFGGPPRLTSW